jgi:hypothetical protein
MSSWCTDVSHSQLLGAATTAKTASKKVTPISTSVLRRPNCLQLVPLMVDRVLQRATGDRKTREVTGALAAGQEGR